MPAGEAENGDGDLLKTEGAEGELGAESHLPLLIIISTCRAPAPPPPLHYRYHYHCLFVFHTVFLSITYYSCQLYDMR